MVRMEIDRLTKAMVYGWLKGLDGKNGKTDRKRRMVLYRKRILRESGFDWTDVERVCNGGEEMCE